MYWMIANQYISGTGPHIALPMSNSMQHIGPNNTAISPRPLQSVDLCDKTATW